MAKWNKCLVTGLSPSYSYKHKKCRCDVCKNWKRRSTHKDRYNARERSRLWRLCNVERSRQNSNNYQKNNPEKVLEWRLKKYNLTYEEYNKIYKSQNGRCAICGYKVKGMQTGKRLCVDHDKDTGKVRGLLCGSCNVGLGHFEHSRKLLKNAIGYLTENRDM